MDFYRLFALLLLARSCAAGPIVVAVAAVAGEIAGWATAETILTSTVASAFGVGCSDVFFAGSIIVDGALYWGPVISGAGVLAGGAVGGGIAAGNHVPSGYSRVTDAKVSKSIMSSISSELSSHSALSVAGSNTFTQMMASLSSDLAGMTHKTELDPFTFVSGKVATRTTITPVSKAAVTTFIPPPPGTPHSSLPAAARPTEIPAGVPAYNWRMCQYDLILMGQNKVNLVFDQPLPRSIRVYNIPSTCMVLANYMVGNPALGPHPVPMGAASLQWNDMNIDGVNAVRTAFGLGNSTLP